MRPKSSSCWTAETAGHQNTPWNLIGFIKIEDESSATSLSSKLFYPPAREVRGLSKRSKEGGEGGGGQNSNGATPDTAHDPFATSSKQNKNNTVQCHVHKNVRVCFRGGHFLDLSAGGPLRWTSQGTPPRLDLLDHFLTTSRTPKPRREMNRGP